MGGGIAASEITTVSVGQVYNIGQFKVTILPGSHPPNFLRWNLLSGKIKKPIPTNASIPSYQMGVPLAFLVEHPKGKLLLHLGAGIVLKQVPQVDTLVLGVANRKSTKGLIDHIIRPSQAKLVIPVHFDDIFRSLNKKAKDLAFVNMDEFYETLNKSDLRIKAPRLTYGKPYVLK